MKTSPPRKYRASEKRTATKEQNRAAIRTAAWDVFCTIGMDAANIREIVNRSGLSPGTFYNYFRTKEAIFQDLSQDLLRRIRTEIHNARAQAATAEQLLSLGYEAYLNLLQSIDGALDFIQRNQHHIRSQLYPSSTMSGLIGDLEVELRPFLAPGALSAKERLLISSIVIAAGAEAVFQAGRRAPAALTDVSRLLTAFMMNGVTQWQPTSANLKPAPDRTRARRSSRKPDA